MSSGEESQDNEGSIDLAEAAALGLDTSAPEFYDATADERNAKWVASLRRGAKSDAILSCPLCFTTLCVDCQQHAYYENQFRAMFVMNCSKIFPSIDNFTVIFRVDTTQIVRPSAGKQGAAGASAQREHQSTSAENPLECQQPPSDTNNNTYNPVHCAVCGTEVGLREIDAHGSGVYHFFHVVASNS